MNTINDTEGEDEFNLNSSLSSLNGKNPFRVDDSYFDAFSSNLNSTISNLEELKSQAPLLASIPKYNPFEVPAGYFDELPTMIQQLVVADNTRLSIKEWLFLFIKPNFIFPVVTTILIAIAAINFTSKSFEQPKTDLAADSSLEEQLYPIDETILVDLLSKNNEGIALASISPEENITDYLIDNNVDEAALNVDFNTTDHENQ